MISYMCAIKGYMPRYDNYAGITADSMYVAIVPSPVLQVKQASPTFTMRIVGTKPGPTSIRFRHSH